MNGTILRRASVLGATAAFGVCAAAMTVGCGWNNSLPDSAGDHQGSGAGIAPQTLKGPVECNWGCAGDVNG